MQTFLFSDQLGRALSRTESSVNRVAKLSGVPKQTISNWLEGRIKKPHQWQPVVKVAQVLHLSEGEPDDLLTSAGHLPIAQLRKQAEQESDRLLLQAWQPVPVSPTPQPTAAPFQVFPDLTYFVGREAELATLKQFLRAGQHVTVCSVRGMGGVGKTALAIRSAYELRAHFSDGVLWARVDTGDPLMTLGAFAAALGHDASQIRDLENRSAFVRGLLASRRVLLILDNATSSEQVRPLLPPSTGHSVALITTRHELAIADETQRIDLHPFVPASGEARLFFAKMLGTPLLQRHAGEFEAIAEHLGHLPLALSIAAGQLKQALRKQQPHEQIRRFRLALQQADHRLDLLQREDRNVRISFDLSYQTLTLPQQGFFDQLGIFSGEDFDAAAAAFVSQSTPQESTLRLEELARHSLVQTARPGRYRLHPLLRDYALEHLRALPQDENQISSLLDQTQWVAPMTRMVEYYVAWIEQHRRVYAALDLEWGNLLAALDAAFRDQLSSHLSRGCNALFHFLEVRGLYSLAEHHLLRACQLAEGQKDPLSLTTTLLNLGTSALRRSEYALAESRYQEALTLARQNGQTELAAWSLRYLSAVYFSYGQYERTLQVCDESLALAHALEERELLCHLWLSIGITRFNLGQFAVAKQNYLASLAVARQLQLQEFVVLCLLNLGEAEQQLGDSTSAEQIWLEGLVLARQLKYRERIALFLVYLSILARSKADLPAADALSLEALTLSCTIQHRWLMAASYEERGWLLFQQGQCVGARSMFQQSQSIADSIHVQNIAGEARFGLAQVAYAEGKRDEARAYAEESRRIFQAIGYFKEAEVVEWLGWLA